MTEGNGHWSQTYEAEGITTENRPAFVEANKKYGSVEAAVVGGYNAQKLSGTPFRFPESMDKLPDDQSRTDFTTQARNLLGINIPKDVESLNDVDFKAGLPEGATADETFTKMVKQWAVEKGVQRSTLEDLIGFYNGPLGKFAQEAHAERQETEKADRAEACNKALIEHFKGEEKVKELTVHLHRAIMNNMDLSKEEAAEFVDSMADTILTTNPVMARGMLNLLSSVSIEGTTESGGGAGGGDGTKQLSPYEFKKQQFPASETLWGKPEDKWEDQSIELKKQAGFK